MFWPRTPSSRDKAGFQTRRTDVCWCYRCRRSRCCRRPNRSRTGPRPRRVYPSSADGGASSGCDTSAVAWRSRNASITCVNSWASGPWPSTSTMAANRPCSSGRITTASPLTRSPMQGRIRLACSSLLVQSSDPLARRHPGALPGRQTPTRTRPSCASRREGPGPGCRWS